MPQSRGAAAVRHITCDGVTKPLPVYSHATVHNGTVYVSAVQGFLPGTFEFPSEAPGDQARQALANLKVILEQAGSSLSRVLKITIFMTDMAAFSKINEAVNEAFPEYPPARSSIAVAELPRKAKVAIEAVAGWRATLILPTLGIAVGSVLVWRFIPDSRAAVGARTGRRRLL